MHVIVVGCGRVGSGLAADLDDAGHTVAIVDKHAGAFRRLPQGFGGEVVTGIGFDRDVLRSAGVERADAVAAVTSGDNSNVVIARTAREHFGVDRVVARIYDPARARIYQRLGIATVATSRWTINQVLRRIEPGTQGTEWTEASGSVVLTGQPVPDRLAGVRATELDLGAPTQLVAVTRLGQAQLCTEDLVLQEGDLLYLAVATDDLDDVVARFHHDPGGTA